VDARRAPKWVLDAYPSDQRAQFHLDWWPPSPAATRFPTPVAPKAGPVPTHERLNARDRATRRAGWWRIYYARTSYEPGPPALEQGITHRTEEASRAEARLVHTSSPRNRTIKARPSNLQPCHRQQASRLRSGQTAIRRHLFRGQCAAPSNHRPKEDRSTGPVRDHGAVEEFR
jgi:hypothetical protein